MIAVAGVAVGLMRGDSGPPTQGVPLEATAPAPAPGGVPLEATAPTPGGVPLEAPTPELDALRAHFETIPVPQPSLEGAPKQAHTSKKFPRYQKYPRSQ